VTQRRWFLRILLGFWYLANFYRELGAASRIQGSINIVCLGESTTAGLWVKFEDSYPKQLERVLRDFYRTNAINVIVPPGSQQRVVPGRE